MRQHFLLLCLLCSTLMTRAENYPYHNDYLWLTVPDHADWIYKTGEKAKVEVTLCKYGIPQNTEISYEIGLDEMPATSRGKAQLKNGRVVIDMGTLKKPGFLDLRLKATIDGTQTEHHVKVGFSPEQLKPYTKNPADFDDFWETSLEQARRTPLNVNIEPAPQYTDNQVDGFLLRLQTDNRHSIYGYLIKPKDWVTRKYPIVLTPPGAGIKTIKNVNAEYASQGLIRLMIEIHGLNPTLSDETFQEISRTFSGENGYVENGLDDRENSYLRHVYVACVRAIDYLTTLPEWDGRNLIVQGGSQGGALSLITAALDKRVTACVANHPALSDVAGYLDNRAGGWPHLNRNHNMLTPQKVQTLQYYDVVNFARRIQCPVYLTWGFNDNVCPPTTSYIVWNVINAPKESLITPVNEHWTTDNTNQKQIEWIKRHLR